jgi:myo-inositol-1(or 4)-monophosphatase
MTEFEDYSRRLAAIAAEATQLVADDLLAAFRGPMAVAYKRDDHDPVTEHDRRAEEKIVDHLLAAVPGSVLVGEEGGLRGEPDADAVTWYVDPIDGTANFARGLDHFATSIGCVLNGQVVAAAILTPSLGRNLFTADLQGAYLNGDPLQTTGFAEESKALMISSYPSANRGEDPAGFARLVAAYGTVRRTGSAAVSLAHVAAGWADAALGTTVHPWDVCAALLLVQQAGGRYRPLWLGEPEGNLWEAPGYLATVGSLDARAAEQLADELETTAMAGVTA